MKIIVFSAIYNKKPLDVNYAYDSSVFIAFIPICFPHNVIIIRKYIVENKVTNFVYICEKIFESPYKFYVAYYL